jgi:acetolactate synthase-1/2/3 large subunit
MTPTTAMTTTISASAAFLDALNEAGVEYIFANLGSDHPGFIEAIAEAKVTGKRMPKLVTCPNEMVALSVAHGYAQVTGRAQAVVVHVECGTQALAGAVHNAAKCRIPVLLFAGASPFTQEGELAGSRNEFVQWIQDVHDQRGLVRGYMRYDNEIRTGRNIKQLVHRALQFANSEPKGPVYLMAAREVLEERVPHVPIDTRTWQPVAPSALAPDDARQIVAALLQAKRPLVVTSYVGRNEAAVAELTRLCRRIGIGVLESVPNTFNFPSDDPLYMGNQGNEPVQNPDLAAADVVLVLDSDVPWIPTLSKPSAAATVYQIDCDPLKQQMPLWYIPALRQFRADAATALAQMNAALDGMKVDDADVKARLAHYQARHEARDRALQERERADGQSITIEYLTARVREHIGDDYIVLNEGITNYTPIHNHIRATRPGSIFRSGGGSLGWNGGAAIGMKLANPDKTIVCMTGDGSYLFTVPSTVHWMARRYDTPFLQIVINNRGWRAPKWSMLAVHPEGHASRAAAKDIGVSFDPPPDHAGIAAAAGGAFARTVKEPGELDEALAAALRAVRSERRCAVLDVWLPEL